LASLSQPAEVIQCQTKSVLDVHPPDRGRPGEFVEAGTPLCKSPPICGDRLPAARQSATVTVSAQFQPYEQQMEQVAVTRIARNIACTAVTGIAILRGPQARARIRRIPPVTRLDLGNGATQYSSESRFRRFEIEANARGPPPSSSGRTGWVPPSHADSSQHCVTAVQGIKGIRDPPPFKLDVIFCGSPLLGSFRCDPSTIRDTWLSEVQAA
jgi:hypothetical protein